MFCTWRRCCAAGGSNQTPVNVIEGRELGREEGREKGRDEGLQIGVLVGLREAILDGVVRRFDPSASYYRRLSRHLESVNDRERLQQMLFTLFEVDSMEAFMAQIGLETNG